MAARLAASSVRGFSVSLDGADAATRDAVRGEGRFKHACRGIRALSQAGAAGVEIRVTVNAHNAARLLDFAPLAADLGVRKDVFKPFRMTGMASSQRDLFIDMKGYLAAAQVALERWPAGPCKAEFGDGVSTRSPEWTRITPAFGCVGGTTSVTVTAKGAVVGCGAVLTANDWRLSEHAFSECWHRVPNLDSWRHLDGNDQCRACSKFSACGGNCRARAVGDGRGMNDPDPWSFCADDETQSAPDVLGCDFEVQ